MKRFILILIASICIFSCDESDNQETTQITKLETLEDAKKVTKSFKKIKDNFLSEAISYDGYGCPEICETVNLNLESNGNILGVCKITGDYLGSTSAGHSGASFFYRGDFDFEMSNYKDFEEVILSGLGVFKYNLRKSYIAISTNFLYRDNMEDQLEISSENIAIEITSDGNLIADTLEIKFLYSRAEESTIFMQDGQPEYSLELKNSYYIKTSNGVIFEWED